MTIGERLSELRKDLGSKQKDIAIRLNVGVSTISNYETDTHEPDLDSLCVLADLYHVSTDYILGRTSLNIDVTTLNEPVYQYLTRADIISFIENLSESDSQYLIRTIRMLHYQHQLEQMRNEAEKISSDYNSPLQDPSDIL